MAETSIYKNAEMGDSENVFEEFDRPRKQETVTRLVTKQRLKASSFAREASASPQRLRWTGWRTGELQVLQDFAHGVFGFDQNQLAAARLEFDFAFGQ